MLKLGNREIVIHSICDIILALDIGIKWALLPPFSFNNYIVSLNLSAHAERGLQLAVFLSVCVLTAILALRATKSMNDTKSFGVTRGEKFKRLNSRDIAWKKPICISTGLPWLVHCEEINILVNIRSSVALDAIN